MKRSRSRNIYIFYFGTSDMGEQLVWACKNGDLDQVKDIMEKPVRKTEQVNNNTSLSMLVGVMSDSKWSQFLALAGVQNVKAF